MEIGRYEYSLTLGLRFDYNKSPSIATVIGSQVKYNYGLPQICTGKGPKTGKKAE